MFRYVFGVSLRPTKSEAIGGWNGQWNPTDNDKEYSYKEHNKANNKEESCKDLRDDKEVKLDI